MVTVGCSTDPRPSPLRIDRNQRGEPAGSPQGRVGRVGRQGPGDSSPVRAAHPPELPSAMPMADAGSMSLKNERSCSREFSSKTESNGTPARETAYGVAGARARHSTRRPDASPSELSTPGWKRARTRFEEGGELAAAPWERCRTTACPEAVEGRGGTRSRERLRRCPRAAQQTRPAETEPTGSARQEGRRATARARSKRLASPQLSAPNRKERRPRAAVLRPSRWFTWVSSFAGFSVSASRRASRLRGRTARRVDPPLGATRVRRVGRPRRGVDGDGTRQTVSHRRPRSLPPGEGLEIGSQARGVTSGVL